MANGAACDMINEMLACNCGQRSTQHATGQCCWERGVGVGVGGRGGVGSASGMMI